MAEVIHSKKAAVQAVVEFHFFQRIACLSANKLSVWNSTTHSSTGAATQYNQNTSIMNHTDFACQVIQWILPHWCDKHKILELC